jgi:protein-tyrosine phosphatase
MNEVYPKMGKIYFGTVVLILLIILLLYILYEVYQCSQLEEPARARTKFANRMIFWKYLKDCEKFTYVVDHLYLTSRYGILQEDNLIDNDISAIVSLQHEIRDDVVEISEKLDIDTLYVVIYDQPDNEDVLAKEIENAVEFVKGHIAKGHNVAVHCTKGNSRSVSVILLYLMREYNMTYDEAYAFVLDIRPTMYPNEGFVRVLKAKDA